MKQIQINGTEPDILNKVCEDLVFTQYQESFVVIESANVTNMKFNAIWYSLCFEGDSVIWRQGQEPQQADNHSFESCLVSVRCSEHADYVGASLLGINYTKENDSIKVQFTFSSGNDLVIEYNQLTDSAAVIC